jgi:hypothetical protein
MKNSSQKSWPLLYKVMLLIAFMAPVMAGISSPGKVYTFCPTPRVTVAGQSSGSVSFSWDSVEGAAVYKVMYVRSEDHYTSSEFTTGSNTMNFSSLPSGTYRFYFETVCDGGLSGWVVTDDIFL